jgi:NhaC family Na+:H+ antiporter
MAQTLGVATFTYLPYCFFNLLNPLVSAAYGFTGFTIEKLPDEEMDESAPPVSAVVSEAG